MTVVVRRFAATPARTASQTWERIIELVSEDSPARKELEMVAGVAASIIAEEIPQDASIVVAGNGPRLRIYCAYGDKAVVGEDCDEDRLTWNPTEGDWKMFLPCPKEDLDWVRDALGGNAKRVFAYDIDKGIPLEAALEAPSSAGSFTINTEEFFKK